MPSAKQQPSIIKDDVGIRPNVCKLTFGPPCIYDRPRVNLKKKLLYFHQLNESMGLLINQAFVTKHANSKSLSQLLSTLLIKDLVPLIHRRTSFPIKNILHIKSLQHLNSSAESQNNNNKKVLASGPLPPVTTRYHPLPPVTECTSGQKLPYSTFRILSLYNLRF